MGVCGVSVAIGTTSGKQLVCASKNEHVLNNTTILL